MSKPQGNKEPEEMRPIPDGGLAETMPAWLRNRPAWSTSTDETEAREVDSAKAESGETTSAQSDDELASPAKPAPEPGVGSDPPPPVPIPEAVVWSQPLDASPIEAASLIGIEDLPDWLQRIAARAERDAQGLLVGETAEVGAVVPAMDASVKEPWLTRSQKVDIAIIGGLLIAAAALLLIWQLVG